MKIYDTNKYELIKLFKVYFFAIDQMSNNFSSVFNNYILVFYCNKENIFFFNVFHLIFSILTADFFIIKTYCENCSISLNIEVLM